METTGVLVCVLKHCYTRCYKMFHFCLIWKFEDFFFIFLFGAACVLVLNPTVNGAKPQDLSIFMNKTFTKRNGPRIYSDKAASCWTEFTVMLRFRPNKNHLSNRWRLKRSAWTNRSEQKTKCFSRRPTNKWDGLTSSRSTLTARRHRPPLKLTAGSWSSSPRMTSEAKHAIHGEAVKGLEPVIVCTLVCRRSGDNNRAFALFS